MRIRTFWQPCNASSDSRASHHEVHRTAVRTQSICAKHFPNEYKNIYPFRLFSDALNSLFMAANALNLCSFFIFAFLIINGAKTKPTVGVFPPSCNRIECPKFEVIEANNGYEIRSYDSPMWMSTAPIDDISLVNATRTGFLQLFDYIQGKNEYHQKIEMTAPVLTQVSPSDGPFCATSFVVSFYIPKENQGNPPAAQGLHVQKWGKTLAAVRQFSGFVKDYDVAEETAALYASLKGSKWFDAIRKAPTADPTTTYTVAQYNSPFEFDNRVNEIWLLLDVKDYFGM